MTPLTPLEQEFGWGVLESHRQECDECDGSGREDPNDPASADCDECDGEGRSRWGSFYVEDRSDCALCKREEVGVNGRLLSNGYTGGQLYVCLPCYVARHRAECGCELWADAEQAMVTPNERRR